MVHLASNPHSLSECRRPCWKYHELLNGQLITSMSTSIDDVQGRHREDELLCSSAGKVCNVLIEWDLLGKGCCSSDGKGNGKDGVSAEGGLAPAPFVLGTVEGFDHELVEGGLVLDVLSLKGGGDDGVDVVHGLLDAETEVSGLVLVSEFQSLVDSCGGA